MSAASTVAEKRPAFPGRTVAGVRIPPASGTHNTGGRLTEDVNLSNAVERIKKLGDVVEKLVEQSNEMRERVINVEENVDETKERVATLEARVERQGALVEALAREEGIDVEDVYDDAGLGDSPEEIAAQRLADEEDGDDDVTVAGT
jgi:hypothetical protein